MKTENKILEMSFDFSLQIISLYKKLVENKEYVLSKQLLRSATSIGANIEEAMATQSKRDFISKMAIAFKESKETRYWLRLLEKSKLVDIDYPTNLASSLHIINILTKIVKQAKRPLHNSTFKIYNSK